jgi:hypothetical protein
MYYFKKLKKYIILKKLKNKLFLKIKKYFIFKNKKIILQSRKINIL